MVVFLLCVKAELENVEEVTPEEHLRYCLDVRPRPRSAAQRTGAERRLRCAAAARRS